MAQIRILFLPPLFSAILLNRTLRRNYRYLHTLHICRSVMEAAAVEYSKATFLCIQVIEFSKVTNAGNITNMG